MQSSARRGGGRSRARLALGLALGAAVMVAQAEALALTWTKGPYLQALGPTSVTIKVELSEPAPVVVEIEDALGAKRLVASQSSASQSSEAPFHAVRVEGLTPASTYRYRVKVAREGGIATGEGRFVTAPEPKDSRPFRFIVYGDNRSDHAAHAAVVRAIEATPSDFLVHTGDMVHTGSKAIEWETFFGIERALLRDRCVFAAVGNHELTAPDPSGKIAFLRYFASAEADGGERAALYGSFRWSNARIFLLNAMDTWTGDDRRWLEAELSRSADEPLLVHRFAVLHHGPFSSGPHGGNTRIAETGALDVLRRHGVSLVFAGHDHTYERGEGAGIKYIVSGGGGAPLYARKRVSAETRMFESTHHFVEVAVDGEVVTTTAHRASGGVIERCSFRGRGSWDCGNGSGQGASPAGPGPAASVPQASACACRVPGERVEPDSERDGSENRGLAPMIVAAGVVLLATLRKRGGGVREA
jgi:acid phosphatase type 7